MTDDVLNRWDLRADGDPIVTHHARLLPVRYRGQAAILKLTREPDEQRGAALMEWWDGIGAARVFARDEDALLLERADAVPSLSDMARTGCDDEASVVLCEAAAQLHAERAKTLPELVPLPVWFRELEPAAASHGGILIRCAEEARHLLAEQREMTVLHGDLHHDNVLHFGERGWLAIDPKGLLGDRTFDFANIFTNPDLSDPTRPVGTDPARFLRRLEIVAEAAKLERVRLLRWIVAWTGLSAAWYLSDGDPAWIDRRIAELAVAELDR